VSHTKSHFFPRSAPFPPSRGCIKHRKPKLIEFSYDTKIHKYIISPIFAVNNTSTYDWKNRDFPDALARSSKFENIEMLACFPKPCSVAYAS